MSERIERFRDLIVYKKAFSLQQEMFEVTKTFPKEDLFSLADQVHRSSRSIGGNISEAWQKRRYPAHFVSKVTDSDGEQAEWLDTALACQYISHEVHQSFLEKCKEIGRMLGNMMAVPEKFFKLR